MKEKEEDRTVRTRVILCARACVYQNYFRMIVVRAGSLQHFVRGTPMVSNLYKYSDHVCTLENGAET